MANTAVASPSWKQLLGPAAGFNPVTFSQNTANQQYQPIIDQIISQQTGNTAAQAAVPGAIQKAYDPYLQQAQAAIASTQGQTDTTANAIAKMAQELGGGQQTNNAAANWGGFTRAQGSILNSQATQGYTNAQKMVAAIQQQRASELASQATQLQQQLAATRSQKNQAQTDAYVKALQLQQNLQSQAIQNAGALLGQNIQSGLAPGNLKLQQQQLAQAQQSQRIQAVQAALADKAGRAQLAQQLGITSGDFNQADAASRLKSIDAVLTPYIDISTGKWIGGADQKDAFDSSFKALKAMYPHSSKAGLAALDTILRTRIASYHNGLSWTDPMPKSWSFGNLTGGVFGGIDSLLGSGDAFNQALGLNNGLGSSYGSGVPVDWYGSSPYPLGK
jgi:hypothetical protein